MTAGPFSASSRGGIPLQKQHHVAQIVMGRRYNIVLVFTAVTSTVLTTVLVATAVLTDHWESVSYSRTEVEVNHSDQI